jgi:hypothetical protein
MLLSILLSYFTHDEARNPLAPLLRARFNSNSGMGKGYSTCLCNLLLGGRVQLHAHPTHPTACSPPHHAQRHARDQNLMSW